MPATNTKSACWRIFEAGRLVLETHNIFAVLAREIEVRYDAAAAAGATIFFRRELRKRHPGVALQHFYEKCRLKLLHAVHYREKI